MRAPNYPVPPGLAPLLNRGRKSNGPPEFVCRRGRGRDEGWIWIWLAVCATATTTDCFEDTREWRRVVWKVEVAR